MSLVLQMVGTKFTLVLHVFCLLLVAVVSDVQAQNPVSVERTTLLRIIEAEDKRLWDNDLSTLLKHEDPSIRMRAALAAGRIGDEVAVPALVSLLQNEKDNDVRAMAAFALGEIESATAGEALVAELAKREESMVRARAIEALGKIAGALPATEKVKLASFQKEILNALEFEASRRSAPDTDAILLGLTAALRARPEGAGKVVAQFLSYSDSRIRADAANSLARLRAKDGNEQLRKLLTTDPDPVVRANAARVLGATEDKTAFEPLFDRALNDKDLRVRVSSLRALASLKDARTAAAFRTRINVPMRSGSSPASKNEILEQVAMMGRVLQGTDDKDALNWLADVRRYFRNSAPPVEIAFASISPRTYLSELGTTSDAIRKLQQRLISDWRTDSAIAQGLGEIAAAPDSIKDKSVLTQQAQQILRGMLDHKKSGLPDTNAKAHPEYAVSDILRALAAFKPKDLNVVLLDQLHNSDVIVRATAAELLGQLPPEEVTASALVAALPVALKDRENDAVLEILDSLAKQKTTAAREAIKSVLESPDYLIRRRAMSLLKTNGFGDLPAKSEPIKTTNTRRDYERAISRFGKTILAVVRTSKGSFTISLHPEVAPLTVDNFAQLAKRGYFNGIAFHRVVPNFVIQGGDPRGDGSGGPGHAIRCEINLLGYDRSAVGMALSGKDTGGSQWFVTHSPQPHLDGGYTVFGKVFDGMDVVDVIERGDVIRSIVITNNGKPEPK